MKTKKITSLIAVAIFMSTTLVAKASSPFVDAFIMETPIESIVQVVAAESIEANVSITDNTGNQMYYDRINSGTSSSRIFDFSKFEDGTYIIHTDSEYMSVTKTISVKNANVKVLNKVTEYKPVFTMEEGILKVNYLNSGMQDIEFTLENSINIFYEDKADASLIYGKMLDISKLMKGEYVARLDVGDKTFYYNFDNLR